METLWFYALAMLASYLLGLLLNVSGLSRLSEPSRYHWTAMLILLLMWLFGAAFLFRDTVGRPDLVMALLAFIPAVGYWWSHQIWRYRRRTIRKPVLSGRE